MANNTFYGYTPKKDEITTGWDNKSRVGNRLDKVNPYEFRKGMDYELIAVGCSRLAESTIEEREKATESVLKNLDTHDGYYTSLITYETLFRNEVEGIKKPPFKTWLSEQDELRMIEVDKKYKNDKMTEPKVKSQEISTKADIKMKYLKEAIEKQVIALLKEQDGEEMDDDDMDKAATKGAKGKKANRLDLEKEAIENLLYRGKKGKESEFTKDEPSPDSVLAKKDEMLQVYKTKLKGKDNGTDEYNALLKKANEKFKKVLEKHVKTFGADGKGNNVVIKDVFGATLPETIKALGARLKDIEKEEKEDLLAKTNERYEIAKTDMTREQHIKLLEIIKDNGISLREGAMGIKTYYEIAKAAYLEGLSNGLKI